MEQLHVQVIDTTNAISCHGLISQVRQDIRENLTPNRYRLNTMHPNIAHVDDQPHGTYTL